MAQSKKDFEAQPSREVVEPSKEEVPAKVETVKVKVLKQVNTTMYGHLYPNAKEPYEISKALAEQLEKLGEVEIVG